MNQYIEINGYCHTQKTNVSALLKCIDTNTGSFLKGTVRCNFIIQGGKCNHCSVRDSFPEEFKLP